MKILSDKEYEDLTDRFTYLKSRVDVLSNKLAMRERVIVKINRKHRAEVAALMIRPYDDMTTIKNAVVHTLKQYEAVTGKKVLMFCVRDDEITVTEST